MLSNLNIIPDSNLSVKIFSISFKIVIYFNRMRKRIGILFTGVYVTGSADRFLVRVDSLQHFPSKTSRSPSIPDQSYHVISRNVL